jgi:hypothetical protein
MVLVSALIIVHWSARSFALTRSTRSSFTSKSLILRRSGSVGANSESSSVDSFFTSIAPPFVPVLASSAVVETLAVVVIHDRVEHRLSVFPVHLEERFLSWTGSFAHFSSRLAVTQFAPSFLVTEVVGELFAATPASEQADRVDFPFGSERFARRDFSLEALADAPSSFSQILDARTLRHLVMRSGLDGRAGLFSACTGRTPRFVAGTL